jgi:predicted acyl esterase
VQVDFGLEAVNPIDRLQVRWFDQFLKGIDTGLLDEPPVCLFEMGSNRWRNFDSWPIENHKSYFFSSTGLASIREGEGTLQPHQPKVALVMCWFTTLGDPVPALGVMRRCHQVRLSDRI